MIKITYLESIGFKRYKIFNPIKNKDMYAYRYTKNKKYIKIYINEIDGLSYKELKNKYERG
jgi:deoxyribodipyrimidine photolyase